jgi:hypothetical protein
MDSFALIEYSPTSYGAKQEIEITDERSLRHHLKQMQLGEPRLIDFVSPQEDCLTLGVGGSLGCAMYSDASGKPPYLSALGPLRDQEGRYAVFDVGGTPTEIPLSRCLSPEEVIEIAVYFFIRNAPYDGVKWEED